MLMKNTTVFMVLLACFLLAACGGRNWRRVKARRHSWPKRAEVKCEEENAS